MADDEGFFILDQYYKPTRYPDASVGTLPGGLPGRKEAAGSLALAKQVYELLSQSN